MPGESVGDIRGGKAVNENMKALEALDYLQHDWQQKDGRVVFDEQCEVLRATLASCRSKAEKADGLAKALEAHRQADREQEVEGASAFWRILSDKAHKLGEEALRAHHDKNVKPEHIPTCGRVECICGRC
jgi:hypothetical protein